MSGDPSLSFLLRSEFAKVMQGAIRPCDLDAPKITLLDRRQIGACLAHELKSPAGRSEKAPTQVPWRRVSSGSGPPCSPAPWYRRALNGGVGGIRRPASNDNLGGTERSGAQVPVLNHPGWPSSAASECL